MLAEFGGIMKIIILIGKFLMFSLAEVSFVQSIIKILFKVSGKKEKEILSGKKANSKKIEEDSNDYTL